MSKSAPLIVICSLLTIDSLIAGALPLAWAQDSQQPCNGQKPARVAQETKNEGSINCGSWTCHEKEVTIEGHNICDLVQPNPKKKTILCKTDGPDYHMITVPFRCGKGSTNMCVRQGGKRKAEVAGQSAIDKGACQHN
jgi:hypothetical protein